MRTRSKVVHEDVFCDICGASTYPWNACQNCHRDLCDKHRREFSDGVHWRSRTGTFCDDCVAALTKAPTPLFVAYLRIAELRKQEEEFYELHKRLNEQAEAEVKRLRPDCE